MVAMIIYLSWIITEVVLNRFVRSKKVDNPADGNSLKTIWIVVITSTILASIVGFWFPLPIYRSDFGFNAFLAFLLLGLCIRLYAVWSLGKMFTVDVAIRQDHALKSDGIYRYVRHPSYTGLCMCFVGLGGSMNHWLAAALIVLPFLWVIILRINVEEKALLAHFGAAYTDYCQRTKRLIPFVY